MLLLGITTLLSERHNAEAQDMTPEKQPGNLGLPTPDLAPGNLYFLKDNDFYLSRSTWLVHSLIDLTTFDKPLQDLRAHIQHFRTCLNLIYPNFDVGQGDPSLDAHVTSIRSLLMNFRDILDRQLSVVGNRVQALKDLQNLKNPWSLSSPLMHGSRWKRSGKLPCELYPFQGKRIDCLDLKMNSVKVNMEGNKIGNGDQNISLTDNNNRTMNNNTMNSKNNDKVTYKVSSKLDASEHNSDDVTEVDLNITTFVPVLQWLREETNLSIPEPISQFTRKISVKSSSDYNVTFGNSKTQGNDTIANLTQNTGVAGMVTKYIVQTVGLQRAQRINKRYVFQNESIGDININVSSTENLSILNGNYSQVECTDFNDTLLPVLLRKSYVCEVYYLTHVLLGETPLWDFNTFNNWKKSVKVFDLWKVFRIKHYTGNSQKWKNFRQAWVDARYLLTYKYPASLKKQSNQKVRKHESRVKRQIWSMDSPLRMILSLISRHHSDSVIQNDINEHVLRSLQHSTSILNGSHIDIEQNRKAIDELIFALNTWKSQWEVVSYNMTQLQRRDRGLRLIIYAEILNALLAELTEQILNREMQINTVLNHRIDPTVLKPTILIDLLENITKQLPLNIFLPYKNDDLISVYKSLDIVTLATTHGILILISIPLLNSRTEFQLYHVVNVAVFLKNTNITAKYQISTEHFAISKDHNWIMYFTADEYNQCNVPHQKYCAVSSPLLHTSAFGKDCLINYFLKKQYSEIKCPVKFMETIVTIEAKYLKAGHWVISVPHEIMLRIVCKDSPQFTILVKSPVYVIKLLPGCEATSHDFKLPAFYKGESDLQLNPDIWYYHKLNNFSFLHNLESKINLARVHIPKQLGKLVLDSTSFAALATNIDDNIAQARHENERMKMEQSSHKKPWYYWFTVATIIILVLIIAGIFLWLYCSRKLMIDKVAERIIYERNPETVQIHENQALESE